MINIWKSREDEMPYCEFCEDFIFDKTNYVINLKSKDNDEKDKTVICMCEHCFNKLISLKKEIDEKEDYKEITR